MNKLEKQLSRLDLQVAKTEQLLKQTRSTKRRSFNELNLLKKQIQLRQQLLEKLGYQISRIDEDIQKIDDLVHALESDILKFQKNYGIIAFLSYKTHSNLSILLWVFSSESFKQAYDRIMYFREFSKFRKNQIFLIKRTKKYLLSKKNEKERKKQTQKKLLDKRVTEKNKLARSESEKNELYAELKKSEQAYKRRIRAYRKDMAKIREQIKEIVLESQRLEKSDKNVQKLSAIFTKNRGKLPWPIAMNEGIVTGNFGKNINESGNEIINDGIYISTKENQIVRSIFNGKVTMITKIPFYGYVVIIQHGNFRSVYANLKDVTVEKDDQVDLLQSIGKVKTNTSTGETQLYFQIYKDYNPVNPLYWIVNKD